MGTTSSLETSSTPPRPIITLDAPIRYCETNLLLLYSFPPKSKQIWRYFSDRTGILSWASFPAIWLFGMRNNLLMGLTGWDFGTFNNFHRWVARIATLEAVIHSVGYTVIIWRSAYSSISRTLFRC